MRIIKYSVRSFLKTPGFTAAALTTLALTVGAAATIFSVVNSTVIQPLPFHDSERLAIVWHRNTQDGQDRIPISEVMLQRLASLGGVFENVGGLSPHWTFVVRRGDVPEPIRGFWVSHTLFPLLGVSPTQGRVFRADEDRAGGPPVVIVSADLWAKHFGPGARLDGQTINVDNRAATIIGVMPEGFRLLDTAGIWTPLQQNPFLTRTNGNIVRMWTPVVRLRPGVSVDTASRESAALAARLSEEFRNSNTNLSARAVSLKDDVVGTQREALLVLLGAVAFVLSIGCANVANLLLARAAARRRDVAVILALGAQRRVLWQNLLTEGALLAGAGTAAGILIAVWATSWIRTIDPGDPAPRARGHPRRAGSRCRGRGGRRRQSRVCGGARVAARAARRRGVVEGRAALDAGAARPPQRAHRRRSRAVVDPVDGRRPVDAQLRASDERRPGLRRRSPAHPAGGSATPLRGDAGSRSVLRHALPEDRGSSRRRSRWRDDAAADADRCDDVHGD